jgi:uncharacterized protein YcgL (UPF0745 family)
MIQPEVAMEVNMAERRLTDIERERIERRIRILVNCLYVSIEDEDMLLVKHEIEPNGWWLRLSVKLSDDQVKEIVDTEGEWE